MGAVAGHASGYLTQGIGGAKAGAIFARTMVAAAVGGTVSRITGGKFANGAVSAAFTHLFNNEGESIHTWKHVKGFVVEEGVNILHRFGQAIGGLGQAGLGIAICAGVVSCGAGGLIGAKGLDNFQSAMRRTDSYFQQGAAYLSGSELEGQRYSAYADLATSGYGLIRSVPKLNAVGNPVRDLFVRESK